MKPFPTERLQDLVAEEPTRAEPSRAPGRIHSHLASFGNALGVAMSAPRPGSPAPSAARLGSPEVGHGLAGVADAPSLAGLAGDHVTGGMSPADGTGVASAAGATGIGAVEGAPGGRGALDAWARRLRSERDGARATAEPSPEGARASGPQAWTGGLAAPPASGSMMRTTGAGGTPHVSGLGAEEPSAIRAEALSRATGRTLSGRSSGSFTQAAGDGPGSAEGSGSPDSAEDAEREGGGARSRRARPAGLALAPVPAKVAGLTDASAAEACGAAPVFGAQPARGNETGAAAQSGAAAGKALRAALGDGVARASAALTAKSPLALPASKALAAAAAALESDRGREKPKDREKGTGGDGALPSPRELPSPLPSPLEARPSVKVAAAQPVSRPDLPLPSAAAGGEVQGSVLRQAAHLRMDVNGLGLIELHLRVRGEALHLRVEGEGARAIESRAGELSRTLAGEGLKLALEIPAQERSGLHARGDGGRGSDERRQAWNEAAESRRDGPPATPPQRKHTPKTPLDGVHVKA